MTITTSTDASSASAERRIKDQAIATSKSVLGPIGARIKMSRSCADGEVHRMRAPTEQFNLCWETLGPPENYIPGLRRYFSKRVVADEIEDLVQEVFVRIQTHRGSSPIERIDRYLFVVAASVLTDRARRRMVRHAADHESLQELHCPVEELTPERVILGEEAVGKVVEAIATLPARTRNVFVLHRFEEISCTSIATLLGMSVSAVEKHVMKALRLLHSRIEME